MSLSVPSCSLATVYLFTYLLNGTLRGRNISEVPWGAYHVQVKLVQIGTGSKKESEQSSWHIAEELGILQPCCERARYMGLVRPITEYATTRLVTTYAERYSVR